MERKGKEWNGLEFTLGPAKRLNLYRGFKNGCYNRKTTKIKSL